MSSNQLVDLLTCLLRECFRQSSKIDLHYGTNYLFMAQIEKNKMKRNRKSRFIFGSGESVNYVIIRMFFIMNIHAAQVSSTNIMMIGQMGDFFRVFSSVNFKTLHIEQ